MKKLFLFTLLIVLSMCTVMAQTTIGTDIVPAKGALLQLKQWNPNNPKADNSNSKKGLGLPRVALEDVNSLKPVLDPNDPNFNTLKLKLQGMMVYNVTDDESKGLFLGVYVWHGDSFWKKQEDIGSDDLFLEVKPTADLIFSSGHNPKIPLTSQSIDIAWSPKSIAADMELLPTLNGGIGWSLANTKTDNSGNYSLAVSPQAFTVAELKADPFLEKESAFTVKSTDFLGVSLSEVRRLKQIHYALYVDGLSPFMDLGRTYTIKVSSNTNWEVNVEDLNGLLDNAVTTLVSASHTANKDGDEFKFKLINTTSNEKKKLTITFSSPEGLWEDQKYIVEATNIYPNSYIVKPGDPIEFPVRKAFVMWANDILESIPEAKPEKAELLWQDEKKLIKNVQLIGTGIDAKIKVETNTDATPLDGSAVVVYKVDGVIRWSWHLWVTDYNPEVALSHSFPTGVNDVLTVTGGRVFSRFNSVKNFVMMDRFLGAAAAGGNDLRMRGYLFQWGRKDLFPPTKDLVAHQDQFGRELYNAQNNVIKNGLPNGQAVVNGLGTIGQNGNAIKCSVTNPLAFYRLNGASDWYSDKGESSNYLWNQEDELKGNYDPCPTGWRVVLSGSTNRSPWYAVTPVGRVGMVYDLSAQGLGPYLGQGYKSGNTHVFPGTCYVWSVDPTLHDMQPITEIQGGYVKGWRLLGRNMAFPVRCAKDEKVIH